MKDKVTVVICYSAIIIIICESFACLVQPVASLQAAYSRHRLSSKLAIFTVASQSLLAKFSALPHALATAP